MKQKFFDTDWWKDTTGAIVGTVTGIILTFGTTFYLQSKDKAEMARKMTKITIHNLDVRIGLMQNEVEMLKAEDSLFRQVTEYMPDSLHKLDENTLRHVINTLGSIQYFMTDHKAESIFSHSFEVWQYLDDEKVIGRISTCYSILDFHNEIYEPLRHDCMKAHREWWNEMITHGFPDVTTAVKAMMSRPDIQLILTRYPNTIRVLENLTDVALQLNKRNKEVLNISQEELEEAGMLLDRNCFTLDN